MKTAAIVALALALTAPLTAIPTASDAQVLTGRGNTRHSAPPRPALSEREEDRLFAAQDAVYDLQQQIDAIEASAEPTAEQTASLPDLHHRLDAEQNVIDRLEAKRDRRS